MSNLPFSLPNGWSAIQLPGGGLTIMPPGTSAPPSSASSADPLAALATILAPTLTSVAGAANPLAGAAVGALFAVGKFIHDELASQPAGSNPSMQNVLQQWFAAATKAFPLQPATPAAG